MNYNAYFTLLFWVVRSAILSPAATIILPENYKSGAILSIEATGIPPDMAVFAKKSNSVMSVKSYIFDEITPPPIYFYKSAAYSLLRVFVQDPQVLCSNLDGIFEQGQLIPASSYREDILRTISDAQKRCKQVLNNSR